jgi:hypothetical protein
MKRVIGIVLKTRVKEILMKIWYHQVNSNYELILESKVENLKSLVFLITSPHVHNMIAEHSMKQPVSVLKETACNYSCYFFSNPHSMVGVLSAFYLS